MMQMHPLDERWDAMIATARQLEPSIVPALLAARYDPATYMRERVFAMKMLACLLMLAKRPLDPNDKSLQS